MNVYDTANRLAKEIQESKEYIEYKNIKDEINTNQNLKEKISEFEKARREMQMLTIQGGTPVEEKATEIQNMYAELIKNEKIKKYFDLEFKFSVLVADINKIIGEAIKDVLM